MTTVAVIGCGRMGSPIARNLLRAGVAVRTFDHGTEKTAALAEAGAVAAASPIEAAAGAEFLLTALPQPSDTLAALTGPEGALAGAGAGLLHIDLGTGTPEQATAIAERCAEAGAAGIDCPVTGGVEAAEAGSLVAFAGGPADQVRRASQGPLAAFTSRVIHTGEGGTGQATKLCNNLLATVHAAALAEAVAAGVAAGVAPATLFEAITGGSGDSRVARSRFPVGGIVAEAPSSRDFEPGFALELAEKDLGFAVELGRRHGIEPAVAAAALERFREAAALGLGPADYSAIFKLVAGQVRG